MSPGWRLNPPSCIQPWLSLLQQHELHQSLCPLLRLARANQVLALPALGSQSPRTTDYVCKIVAQFLLIHGISLLLAQLRQLTLLGLPLLILLVLKPLQAIFARGVVPIDMISVGSPVLSLVALHTMYLGLFFLPFQAALLAYWIVPILALPVRSHVFPLLTVRARCVSVFFICLLDAGYASPVSQSPLLLFLVVGIVWQVLAASCTLQSRSIGSWFFMFGHLVDGDIWQD
mmetsp:Transcript_63739/g.122530  ORF Transcript_63739/g.122530 Transcript_63739/m.122530 type:complete len:231 (+) Transcript_63739:805-1497(+)